MMTILTEPEAQDAKYVTRAIAFLAHPSKGNSVADVVVANNAQPIGTRIRALVNTVLGDGWEVLDWYDAEGEF